MSITYVNTIAAHSGDTITIEDKVEFEEVVEVRRALGIAQYNENILDNPLGYLDIIKDQNKGLSIIPLDGFPVNRWKSYAYAGGTVSFDADGTFNFNKPLSQFVESSASYGGREMTVSAKEISVDIRVRLGGNGSWHALLAGTDVEFTDTWQIGGTNPEYIYVEALSDPEAAYSIKCFKMEEGVVRTPFLVPDVSNNRSSCLRHYFILGDGTTERGEPLAYCHANQAFTGNFGYPVEMYSVPDILISTTFSRIAYVSGAEVVETTVFNAELKTTRDCRFLTTGTDLPTDYAAYAWFLENYKIEGSTGK